MATSGTLVQPVLVIGFKQPLQINDFITLPFIPLHLCTDNQYTVLNYYKHLYHKHHMAILQPSALACTVLKVKFICVYLAPSILCRVTFVYGISLQLHTCMRCVSLVAVTEM